VKLGLKQRLGLFEPLQIDVYRGHGTPQCLRVRGRVLEQSGTRQPDGEAGILRNTLDTIRRMESDEIPGARLRVRLAGATEEVETDDEGYFSVDMRPATPLEPGWHDVRIELIDSMAGGAGLEATGRVLVPDPEAEFGVISDLDDTVIRTGATNKLTHTRLLFSRNAVTHVPFEGIDDFYRRLRLGPDGRGANPVFYVSRSGWNLHDMFVRFLDEHDLPRGAMYMQDTAIIEPKSEHVGHEQHKRRSIDIILGMHEPLPFVLVGDSGQEDPETYLAAAERWPGRIHAVYVRDVTDPDRDREVRRIMDRLREMGVPALAAEETSAFERHAREHGLVPTD